MDAEALENLLKNVSEGALSVEAALGTLRGSAVFGPTGVPDLGYARVDHHRELRQGMPEVVFGENKSAEQLDGIIQALRRAEQGILVTRCDAAKAESVQKSVPGLIYNPIARTLSTPVKVRPPRLSGKVAVVTAGTSDQAVAEEACVTLQCAGEEVSRFYDVGVAGIHRLFAVLPEIAAAPAVICLAGMEGALPSVLGGLVRAPVIAVPTSVGYGAALGGFTALLGMLTGCASGVTVVNIDNGFGAAMAVLRLAQVSEEGAKK